MEQLIFRSWSRQNWSALVIYDCNHYCVFTLGSGSQSLNFYFSFLLKIKLKLKYFVIGRKMKSHRYINALKKLIEKIILKCSKNDMNQDKGNNNNKNAIYWPNDAKTTELTKYFQCFLAIPTLQWTLLILFINNWDILQA